MRINKKVAVLVAGAVSIVGLGSIASAASGVDVHKSDFIAGLSDTRATGYYGFGPKGLVIRTDSNTSTDKVAEYYKPSSTAFPTTASQVWVGTQPEPGKQIVFDSGVTGDTGYNILVGEPVYGDDWWMSTGSYIYKNHHSAHGAANGTDELCPLTTGGSGSDCHGTLAQWKAAFASAKVSAVGFSLGSGVKGDGVLKSQTYGDTTYTFSDTAAVSAPPAAPTSVDVKGSATTAANKHRVTFNMTTAATPAGSVQGAPARWSITVNGKVKYTATEGAGSAHTFGLTTPGSNKKKHVKLYLNDALYASATVR